MAAMTWPAMCGNGRIAGLIRPIACCAGAPGSMLPYSCAHRTDSWSRRRSGTSMLGFGVPGRPVNPLPFIFFFFSFSSHKDEIWKALLLLP